jgi:TolA-binding protein
MRRSTAPSSPQHERNAQHTQAHEERAQQQVTEQTQQLAQERQRDALSRQSNERQKRIDRLQQRVQQLRAQQPQGRSEQRTLQAQQRLLDREQLAQQRELSKQQKLGLQQATPQRTAATAVQAAAAGRFAARFRNNGDAHEKIALAARLNGWSPRNAWQHHVRAAFVPWIGPVFWPYAYADIFDYTFWPTAYDDAYWAYAYDDFLDTIFWDVGSPYSAYASIEPNDYFEPGSAMVGSSQLRERSGLSPQALRQLCSNPDRGITAWPFADIARALRPTAKQRELLDQLKRVAAQAADALKNSCSENYALTPPGRLQAMINRISATLEAVRIVRPALELFYNSLSDEQQARFNAMGPRLPDKEPQQETNAKQESCGAPKTSLTKLPIERINTVLHPTGIQKNALDRLSTATRKSVQILQGVCPDVVPISPVGRLQAMETQLSAILDAANQIQPALNEFYASLTSEQKARFNTLQQVAGQ